MCQADGELVLCDACPRGAHAACAGLAGIPDGDWYCPRCACGACGKGPVATGVRCGGGGGGRGEEGEGGGRGRRSTGEGTGCQHCVRFDLTSRCRIEEGGEGVPSRRRRLWPPLSLAM